ncbi:MAG: CotH kinase family protein, partial [Clostridia bacterium]|nr:CotH kinase family protein [Clostridia bacterium]
VSPIEEPAGTEISAPFVNRPGYHLKHWTLNGEPYQFTVMPEENITLEAEWSEELTNLPALFIDLSDESGNQVNLADVQKSYVKSTISLSNTEDEYILSSLDSQFKGRGNGSWNEAKKGYKIKFDKKQSLFGRAANKHWVIIACANFDDPTMSRNYLAYNMAGEVFDGIEYSTNAVWVDIYVNGEYRGVYILCEHVRVGTGRVDIESEYTNEPEANGFLIEYDAYAAGTEGVDYFRVSGLKYGFSMHSPDPEDYAEEITKAEYQHQVSYIQDYVTRVYNAALSKNFTEFSELADVDSFVDMYILHELFKNMDTGYSSFYLYKKPNGKLYAGPPWDFDATTSADDGNGRGNRTPQGLYVATGAGSDNTICELY